MIALAPRLRSIVLGWGTVGITYVVPCLLLQQPGVVLDETALDQLVTFDPRGVWLYLSFFALIPFAYLCADESRVPWLTGAMQLSALVCGAIFILFPTTLNYPPVDGSSLSDNVLRFIAANDSVHNCLPSLHAALTCLAAIALVVPDRPCRNGVVLLWSMAITYSILQTRRHLAIDISAGVLVALVCGMLTAWRLPLYKRMVP